MEEKWSMGKRKKKFTEEQERSYKHDFPLSEVWETCHILAKLIVPRLRAFKDADKYSCPNGLDMRRWNQTIQKMIDAFVLMQDYIVLTEEDDKKIAEGLGLFCKYFRDLWD